MFKKKHDSHKPYNKYLNINPLKHQDTAWKTHVKTY